MTAEQGGNKETEVRYRNEARLGSSLAADPRFVRSLGVGCLDGPDGFAGRMFLITELVAGLSLEKVIVANKRGISMDRALSIGCEIARALVSVHARGIVHRDIKPGNVLLEQKGDQEHVRLIDFGIAYATGEGESQSEDVTRDGQAPGTPLYMSPQQALHGRPVPTFDTYSFGVLLYELICGDPPRDGLPLKMLIKEKCDPYSNAYPIDKMAPNTPVKVAEVIGRCLSFSPAERPTAAEIVEVLAAASGAQARAASTVVKVSSVIAEGARDAGDATRADIRHRWVWPRPCAHICRSGKAPEKGMSLGPFYGSPT